MMHCPGTRPPSTSPSTTTESDTTALDTTAPSLTPATSISGPVSPTGREDRPEDCVKEFRNSRRVTRPLGSPKSDRANQGLDHKENRRNELCSFKNGLFENDALWVQGGRDFSSHFERLTDMDSDGVRKEEPRESMNLNRIADFETSFNSCVESPTLVPKCGVRSRQVKTSAATEEASSRNGAKSENAARRSKRLSALKDSADAANDNDSALGKRTLDTTSKGQDKVEMPNRRPKLRPRIEGQIHSESPSSVQAPSTKKRRVSEAVSPGLSPATSSQSVVKERNLGIHKKKEWLSQGLYAGQNPGNSSTPRSKRARTNTMIGESQNAAVFPLPIYAGARLLEAGRAFKLPFGVFSPLPHRQPKLNEWRKANKSESFFFSCYTTEYQRILDVFVGDAASIWKASKLKEHSTCTCTKESGCDENCQNRYMFYECDDTNCRLGPEVCRNRSFGELRRRCKAGSKFNIGVEVIKTSNRGYGVRSNRSFDPNQIIIEYTGEILTQEECERRMRTVYKKSECYYLMHFDQSMVIDATRGSIARFINHSCEPNCRMEKWTVAGKPRMALFAGEDGIVTGEELTYDYNFDPYSQKNVQECRCGAATCRGVLGPKPKDYKNKGVDVKRKRPAQTIPTTATAASRRKRMTRKYSKSTPMRAENEKLGPRSRLTTQPTKLKTNIRAAKAGTGNFKPTTLPVKRRGRPPSAGTSLKTNERVKKQTKQVNESVILSSDRQANSIAAARCSNSTPAVMKRFLEAAGDPTLIATPSLTSRNKRTKVPRHDSPGAIAGKPLIARPRGRPRKVTLKG
ncbi:hypothetical protein LOZ55_000972 [Ophidiomyces ophidiicola]|nr:hypothetical protein LOZ55_000972 [Ophidiomyces ophidiicola]KAI1991379.1 hypothetical protein LOZ54_002133 [Ophidiomyces ophidiicola]